VIVIDTSVVYALLDARDTRHREALQWYEQVADDVATTPPVLAEIDHLARARAGPQALAAFRRDVVAGAYFVDWWRDAAAEAIEVAERYRDLHVSLADGSLVALAGRLGTDSVATFDERHFRAMRPVSGFDAFSLLPADAAA
jgi:predicted nucleic acid-binding protein